MKHLLLNGVAFAVVAGAFGCDKAEAPATPLTASFQLLNEQGQEATAFPRGENLIFLFRITNPTDRTVMLKNPPIDDTHFLEVRRLTPGEGSGDLGKPYTSAFCTYQGGVVVPARGAITLSIPWVESPAFPASLYFCGRQHAPTTYLPVGRYRTSFATPLTILRVNQPDEVTKTQTFTREFEVK